MPVVTVHSLNSHRRLPIWCGRFYAKCCARQLPAVGGQVRYAVPIGGGHKEEAPMQVYYFTELPYHEYRMKKAKNILTAPDLSQYLF